MPKQFIRDYSLYITGPKYKVYDEDNSQLAREITSPLRVSFHISKTITREPNSARIKIYNLSPNTEREIILEGAQVVFKAGYKDNSGVIFKGQVYQPLRNKEGATDYVLNLSCLDGDAYLNLGFLSGTILSNQSRRKIASQILRDSSIELDSSTIDELPETNFVDGSTPHNERAKVVFGNPGKYLTNLSKMGNSTFYVDNNEGRFFNPLSTIGKDEAHLITMDTGMISSPQQIPYGVSVRCLLNPLIRLGDFIKIDNKSVIMSEMGMSGDYYAHLLNADGIYRVVKIDYVGDSHSNAWYCDITALTQVGLAPALMAGSYGYLML